MIRPDRDTSEPLILEDILKQIDDKVEALDLSCNDLSGNLSSKDLKIILERLMTHSTLKLLDLSRNDNIVFPNLDMLSKLLSCNDSLQVLYLEENMWSISENPIQELASTLGSLRELHLGGNSLGDRGALILADLIASNNNLEILTCWDNSIKDEGATAIARDLTNNTTLTCLDLSQNLIGDDGAIALAAALWTNNTLQQFDISENLFWTVGRQALIEAHQLNFSIIHLNEYNSQEHIIRNQARRRQMIRYDSI